VDRWADHHPMMYHLFLAGWRNQRCGALMRLLGQSFALGAAIGRELSGVIRPPGVCREGRGGAILLHS
jgi:hypothetical protein